MSVFCFRVSDSLSVFSVSIIHFFDLIYWYTMDMGLLSLLFGKRMSLMFSILFIVSF